MALDFQTAEFAKFIEMQIRIEDEMTHAERVIMGTAFENLEHAAASLRKDAIESISISPEESPEGFPPHSRRGQLQRAIVYHVDEREGSAVVGPRASVVGQSGSAHEFGGRYRGGTFPERPFMGPALERAIPRFAGHFSGSFGA